MKKYILIFCLTLIGINIKSQNKARCVDTIIAVFENYDAYHKLIEKGFFKAYYLNDTIYFYKNRAALKRGMRAMDAYTKGILNLCKDKPYFVFCNKKARRIAEGLWDIEGFHGMYKEYYKDGKLKESGTYNGDAKEKIWTYYSEEGKAIKEEVYESGKLLSSKNL